MDRFDVSLLVGLVVMVTAMLATVYTLSDLKCSNQADKMGMRSDFGPLQGCMIEHQPGKWIPLKNYRVL